MVETIHGEGAGTVDTGNIWEQRIQVKMGTADTGNKNRNSEWR
jgi:hypothetical protein